jgi:uncharacterized protein (TIGR04255 family)
MKRIRRIYGAFWVQYLKPPIVEAVIGIVFKTHVKESLLEHLVNRLKADYPVSQKQVVSNFEISLGQDGVPHIPNANTPSARYILESVDGTQAIVVSGNEFIFSQRAPYCGWELFLSRFKRDWAKLRYSLGILEIAKFGLRYINRLDIPSINNIVEHENYFSFFPSLPDGLVGPLDNFHANADCFVPDLGARLILNAHPVPPAIMGVASFFLDIDLVVNTSVPQSDADIIQKLIALRVKKNNLFEGLVTDKARKLFGYADSN